MIVICSVLFLFLDMRMYVCAFVRACVCAVLHSKTLLTYYNLSFHQIFEEMQLFGFVFPLRLQASPRAECQQAEGSGPGNQRE